MGQRVTAAPEHWIQPQWPAPAQVRALTTTRQGGVSLPPFKTLNLGDHVGDNPEHVLENRARLQRALGEEVSCQWLQQVHGTDVVAAAADGVVREADASITSMSNLACLVMTADCLPVLLCDQQGTQVAAAHAGWRGLVAGVLENTVQSFEAPPEQLMAWFGPAIGPHAFEVGDEVREQFCALHPGASEAFIPNPAAAGKWFADIYQLARLRLQQAGVAQIYGGGLCTYTDEKEFYSYRRDGVTGRMASLIWLSDT